MQSSLFQIVVTQLLLFLLDDFMTDTFDAVSSNPLKEEAVNYDADTFGSALDDGLGGESVLAPEPEAVKPELVQPAAPNYSLPREEPEKILKWREEQKLRLEQKGIILY